MDQPTRIAWRRLRSGEVDYEMVYLPVFVFACAGFAAWARIGLPFPSCAFHQLTGCPCPSCGSTRALLRILEGDLFGAVAMNPGTCAIAAGVALYCSYAATVLALRLPRLRVESLSPRAWAIVRVVVVVAAAGNWAWVWYAGV